MGKFDFVNTDLSKLESNTTTEEYISVRPPGVIRRTVTKYIKVIISCVAVSLLASASLFWGWLNPGNSEEISHTQVKSGGENSDDLPEELKEPGLEAGFAPEGKEPGTLTDYKLNLKMISENQFEGQADISITNTSEKNWSEVMLYFQSNQLLNMSRKDCYKKVLSWAVDKCLKEINDGKVELKEVKFNGEVREYVLNDNSIKFTLPKAVSIGHTAKIEIKYTFSIPALLREDGSYNLLQWYPMVPDYQNEWIVKPSTRIKDTYTLNHSNIQLTYDFSEAMHVATSSDADPVGPVTTGATQNTSLKEMFVMLFNKNQETHEEHVNDIKLRLFTLPSAEVNKEEIIKTASEAIRFFEEKIGKYPYKQLDIVVTDKLAGNYPGVIVIPDQQKLDSLYLDIEESFEHAIVYNLVQQWFYGPVMLDRDKEPWLNDGLAEFATSLYFMVGKNKSEKESFAYPNEFYEFMRPRERLVSNLPLDTYRSSVGGVIGYLQAQPTMKLWELIEPYGGESVALAFLSDYYHTYSYKKVTTSEIVRFAQSYFKVSASKFSDWLELEDLGESEYEF